MRIAISFVGFLTAACASFPYSTATDNILQLVGGSGTCTTWSVAPGWWLSAKHCEGYGAMSGWTIGGAEATVVASSPTADLMLLRGPVVRSIPMATMQPPLGSAVVVLGYGMGRPTLLWFTGHVVSRESAFFLSHGDDAPVPQFLVSGFNGMPGMSGAPITYRGQVVSQLSGGGLPHQHTQLLSGGVLYADLMAFVRQHVRAPLPTDPPKTSTP